MSDEPAVRAASALLLGNHLPSLAVARSLAAAGYRVIAGDGGEYDLLSRSRACHETWKHPPADRPDELLDALDGLSRKRPDIELIVPLRETYVDVLATKHERLPSGPVLVSPPPRIVTTCMTKASLYDVARHAGVITAPYELVRDHAELHPAASRLGYPIVVKRWHDAAPFLPPHRKAIVCATADDLSAALPSWPDGSAALLVQRYVRGLRTSITFAASNGLMKPVGQHVVVRTDRSDGAGSAVEGYLARHIDRRLERSTRTLVEAIGYTGVGTAQYIVPEDGEPRLMEINPRMGIGLARVRHLDVDVPMIAVELARGGSTPRFDTLVTPQAGKTTVWTSRALYGLMVAHRRGEIDRAEALRGVRHTLRAAIRADNHATFDLTDPWPTVGIYADLLRVLLRPDRQR